MKQLIISNEEELKSAMDDNGDIISDGDIIFKIDVFYSHGVHHISSGGDISSGGNIISRGHISSGGDISSVGNISSDGNIISGGNIDCGHFIYTQSLYGIHYKGELFCRAVVPSSGFGDRALWAERFGIDTSTGCWKEFVERLAVVAPELLKDEKRWLPVERLMLESSMGKYRRVK